MERTAKRTANHSASSEALLSPRCAVAPDLPEIVRPERVARVAEEQPASLLQRPALFDGPEAELGRVSVRSAEIWLGSGWASERGAHQVQGWEQVFWVSVWTRVVSALVRAAVGLVPAAALRPVLWVAGGTVGRRGSAPPVWAESVVFAVVLGHWVWL